MEYPEDSSICEYLNATFAYHYIIYNVSEQKYNPDKYNFQVVDFVYPGYPNPPLEMLFVAAMNIEKWLQSDNRNIAIVHCQSTIVNLSFQGRSMIIICVYIVLNYTNFTNIGEGIVYLQHKLKKPFTLNASQKRYLSYVNKICQCIPVIW